MHFIKPWEQSTELFSLTNPNIIVNTPRIPPCLVRVKRKGYEKTRHFPHLTPHVGSGSGQDLASSLCLGLGTVSKRRQCHG